MNWVELAEHLIEVHGHSAHYIDELDADECRALHRDEHDNGRQDHEHR